MKKHPGVNFPARVWIWRAREAERVGEGGGGKNIAKKSLTWVFRNQGGGGGGGDAQDKPGETEWGQTSQVLIKLRVWIFFFKL